VLESSFKSQIKFNISKEFIKHIKTSNFNMGSKNVASIIIVIFFVNVLFSASLSSAHVPVAGTSKLKQCPDLRVCVNLLKDLVSIVIGAPQCKPCCPFIAGLVDVEAHACLCTAIKGDILGIDINIPLKVLLNVCGRKVPSGSVC
ncbi:hypothetical protein KIW84_031874, partial [Lathyrus oleraceus]